jgi:hypothetical protein
MTLKLKRPLVYFARGEGIKKMGPYTSELRAWQALRGHDGLPVEGATVWPEEDKEDEEIK